MILGTLANDTSRRAQINSRRRLYNGNICLHRGHWHAYLRHAVSAPRRTDLRRLTMGPGMLRFAAVLLSAVSALSVSAQADFAAGMQAQQAGDHVTAFKEWLKDAKKGNKYAQFNIAEMLRQGRGTERDMKAAFAWYLRAADQGLIESQRNVGIMYGRAIGVDRDDIESYKWLSIAAAQGDRTAAKSIDFMQKRMIREFGEADAKKKIGEAKLRAATWQPKSGTPAN